MWLGGPKSLHSSLRMSRPPLVMWSASYSRVHRNLMLISPCVFPQISRRCLVCRPESPPLAARRRRGEGKGVFAPAAAPSSLIHGDYRTEERRRVAEPAQRRKVYSLFPPDLLTRTSCVTSPCGCEPELDSLPCDMCGLH